MNCFGNTTVVEVPILMAAITLSNIIIFKCYIY